MTVPSNSAAPSTLMTWIEFRNLTTQIKAQIARLAPKFTAGTVNASDVLDGIRDALHPDIPGSWGNWIKLRRTVLRSAAMTQIARIDVNDANYAWVASYDELEAALLAVVNWIDLNFPRDPATGTELSIVIVDGVRTSRVFSEGEMDALLVLILAVDALIA